MEIRNKELEQFLENIDEQLEESGRLTANRAFNLGCWLGLAPAVVLTAIVFFLSEGSWVVTVVSAVMILISLIAIANLIAYISKNKALKRTFIEEIQPQIDAEIRQMHISKTEFCDTAAGILPPESLIIQLLNVQLAEQKK
jgi:hypothetical protein